MNSSSPKLDDSADVVRVRCAKNEVRSIPSVGETLPHSSSTPRSFVPAFLYTSIHISFVFMSSENQWDNGNTNKKYEQNNKANNNTTDSCTEWVIAITLEKLTKKTTVLIHLLKADLRNS